MSVVDVDHATGALVVEGRKVFPLVLSNGPPLGAKTPGGEDALAALAAGGASFIRVGRSDWSPATIDQQIAAVREQLDAAAAHGLRCWLQLGNGGRALRPRPARRARPRSAGRWIRGSRWVARRG